ncbi:hypothetical protein PROCOU_13163 [Listeria rocourtiae FSL F6-920]|nr:hypothetical protein PROCOU_13163 [Listeria rocourtiae FSL F6-920]
MKMELQGLGYRVIAFEESGAELENMILAAETAIKNECYKVAFTKGEITLETATGERKAAFIELEDSANAGDTYDYSPLAGDTTRNLQFTTAITEKSSKVERLILTGVNKLPFDLENRTTNEKQGELSVKMVLELKQGSELLACHLEVDNQIKSHRLRLKVNTGVSAASNIASLPFGYIERTPGVSANWQETYSEMPIDIEPLEQSVTLTTDTKSCTVFTCGIKEYQQQESQLALTLLATTGQLGKPDLAYRPGRASGDTTKKGHVLIATEGAQLIGQHTFSLAIYLGEQPFDEYKTALRSREFNRTTVSYQRQPFNHFLHRLDNKIQKTARNRGLKRALALNTISSNYLISACYPSYYESDKYIIRIENPTRTPLKLEPSQVTKGSLERINALEESVGMQDFTIPAYDAITLRVTF